MLLLQTVPAVSPSASYAGPNSASLTEIQLREAEKLYELMRERTGKDLPRLSASPNATVRRMHMQAQETGAAAAGWAPAWLRTLGWAASAVSALCTCTRQLKLARSAAQHSIAAGRDATPRAWWTSRQLSAVMIDFVAVRPPA